MRRHFSVVKKMLGCTMVGGMLGVLAMTAIASTDSHETGTKSGCKCWCTFQGHKYCCLLPICK